MSSGNGVIAAKAIEILNVLGHDRAMIAATIGCHRRTVARWEAGQFSPNRRNRAALQALVGELLVAENAAASNARSRARVRRLEVAREALLTDADRAERDRFEQEMREKRDAILAESQPRSVIYQVDPFAVVGQDAEMAAVEAVFG